jgi:hypothetical protein
LISVFYEIIYLYSLNLLELYPTDISVRPHCPESGSRGTGEPHRAEYRPCTDTWKTRGRWVAEAPTKLNTHYHN